jgi:hypothetical protein
MGQGIIACADCETTDGLGWIEGLSAERARDATKSDLDRNPRPTLQRQFRG